MKTATFKPQSHHVLWFNPRKSFPTLSRRLLDLWTSYWFLLVAKSRKCYQPPNPHILLKSFIHCSLQFYSRFCLDQVFHNLTTKCDWYKLRSLTTTSSNRQNVYILIVLRCTIMYPRGSTFTLTIKNLAQHRTPLDVCTHLRTKPGCCHCD